MPNNLRFEQESAQSGLIPLQQMKHTEVKHVISNSFGFGGNCSSLIFSKID
jgi:3-oxoacyl-[acyl-carrier-protein] synthase-1